MQTKLLTTVLPTKLWRNMEDAHHTYSNINAREMYLELCEYALKYWEAQECVSTPVVSFVSK